MTPDFKLYQQQVVKNAKALETELKALNYKLVADGTDSHMVLVNLRDRNLDGARIESVLEAVNMACNKNSIPGDKSALTPGGIRIGTPAATTRGFSEEDFKRVARLVDQCVIIARQIQDSLPKEANKLKDFKAQVVAGVPELQALKKEITEWASTFPLPI